MDKTMATLAGGVDLQVTFRDGRDEVVKVRQLRVSELGRYMTVAEDEAGMVALFCDRPRAWCDTLTDASFEAIVEAGEGLNLDPLSRYAARGNRRREKIMPGVTDRVLASLRSRSPSSAPELPSGSV